MKIKRKKKKISLGKSKRGRPEKNDIKTAMTIAARRRLALKMRQEGKSYFKIGEACGTDQAIAWKDVNYLLSELNDKTNEEVEKLRRLELTRLDRLLEQLKMPLKSKDYYERLAAIDKAVKIMDRRARYIIGMDAPVSSKIGVEDGLEGLLKGAGSEVLLMLKRLAGEEEEEE